MESKELCMTRISDTLKKYSARHALVNLVALISLSAGVLFLASCKGVPKRSEIDALVWLNNSRAMHPVCSENLELTDIGFYRALDDGSFEFVSFCDENASDYLSIYKDDFEELLKKYQVQD